MHNVLSDEKDKEPSTSTSTSTSSPSVATKRGVGKRVQLAKILGPSSPPKEPEIIGEGLPLIQRLRLLKQKEERERKQQEEREAMMQSLMPTQKPQSPPVASTSASAMSKPFGGAALLRALVKTNATVEHPPTSTTSSGAHCSKDLAKSAPIPIKTQGDKRESVSSMDSGSTLSSPPSSALANRALSPPIKPASLLIGEAAAIAASKATTEPISISAPPMPPKLTSQMSFSPPIFAGSMFSSGMEVSSVGRDRSASASSALTVATTEPLAAHLIRPGALHFRQKTYGSVDDLSPEFSRLPFVKKLKILNERQKIAVLLMSKTSSNVLTRSTSEGSNENTTVTGSAITEAAAEDQMHSVALGRRTQSNQEQLQGQGEEGSGDSIMPVSFGSLPKYNQSPPEREGKADGQKPSAEKRTEDSTIQVPSTSQIPASLVQTRPANATTTTSSTISIVHVSNTATCLTKLDPAEAPITISTNSSKVPSRLSPSPTSIHGGGGGSKKRKKAKKMHATASPTDRKEDDGSSSSSSSSTPSPPELDSTETPERRNLKSILKRLAKSDDTVESETKRTGDATMRRLDERKLMKAPTIEGYAARHRKFSKNVTFHKQAVTVVSPDEVAVTGRPGVAVTRTTEGLQVCQTEEKICDPYPESGTGTQTEQLIPVSEHSYAPDVSV